jgi:hypothetical protein
MYVFYEFQEFNKMFYIFSLLLMMSHMCENSFQFQKNIEDIGINIK